MNAASSLRALLAVIALAAAAFAGWKFRTARHDRAEITAATQRHEALRTRIASLEAQLTTGATQAESIERDNASLKNAIEQASAVRAAAVARATTPTPVALAFVEERFKQARVLMQNGSDPAAALRELLWCYDEGFGRSTDRRRDTQLTLVASALVELGKTYPPALAALRERLEKARQHFLASVDHAETVGEISSLSRALREQNTLVALFDQLPAGDSRRSKLAIVAFEPFVEARRYQDALAARAYPMMNTLFEMTANREPAAAAAANPAQAESMRRALVQTTAKNVEVLAGAGQLEQARALAGRLLKLDDSPATQATLQQHLERAGQPALLRAAAKP